MKAADAGKPCDMRAVFRRVFSEWVAKSKMPPKAIASDLRVSVATIWQWCSGGRWPQGRHLQAIVDYTGIPACRLVCCGPRCKHCGRRCTTCRH